MEPQEKKIYEYLEEHKEEIVEDILALVKAESPSRDKEALDKCKEVLKGLYEKRLGVSPTVYPSETSGDNLCTEIGEGEKKILMLGHFDTVHPIGSFPVRREGDRLYGPGVIDMKGGDVAMIWALKALRETGIGLNKRVIIVNNSDEEIGSMNSRGLILEKAKGCQACIVAEPAELKTGRIKTCRKGLAQIKLRCYGKAAHSGNNPRAGVNANIELANQIIWLEGLSDYELGTTFSVNLISGGSAANTVCDYAEATVDWRLCQLSELERIERLLEQRKACVPGARAEFETIIGRPPYAETEEVRGLYELVKETGRALDMEIEKGELSGGGSDGNLVAAMGIPTIDGMGVAGDAQHTPEEQLYLEQLVPKTAMLAAFLNRL